MKRIAVAMVVGGTLVACASSTTGTSGGGCADISGNWELTSIKTSGDCPETGGDGKANITMRKDGDSWVVVFPGVPGGCPGDFDAKSCKFVANCEVRGAADGGAPKVIGAFGLDWTFDGSALKGSEIGKLFPPAAPKACEDTYTDTGKKL